MVFIAFQKPKLCLWVIIALLFLNSAFNFLYLKTFDKFSSFPFTFLYCCFTCLDWELVIYRFIKIKILRVDFSLYINRHNAVIVNKL
ncbi:O antigen polymerase Wzy [Escherichia coli DEC12C]|nr:O antigen polymerase Wzy [Escherichia coli DEC12C]